VRVAGQNPSWFDRLTMRDFGHLRLALPSRSRGESSSSPHGEPVEPRGRLARKAFALARTPWFDRSIGSRLTMRNWGLAAPCSAAPLTKRERSSSPHEPVEPRGHLYVSLVDLCASTPSSSGLSRGSAAGRSATNDIETAAGSVLSMTRQRRQILGTSPRMTAEQGYPHMRPACPQEIDFTPAAPGCASSCRATA
jgi:hypothetical protein